MLGVIFAQAGIHLRAATTVLKKKMDSAFVGMATWIW
jgi:hypothetical protein